MKKLRKAALILALLLTVGILWSRVRLAADLKNLEFTQVDVSRIPDGTYRGRSDVGPVTVEAEVRVLDGEIEEVVLLRHDNGMGRPAEVMTGTMMVMETWDVECVSGATVSSQAIRQAVNRALVSAVGD